MRHSPPDTMIELAARGSIISVQDNGPGIPIAERDRVLEPMYRLDKSRHTPGSGLGLALWSRPLPNCMRPS